MKPLNRNLSVLEHIVSYCEQIEATIDRFGDSYAVFPKTRSIEMRRPSVSSRLGSWSAN